MLEHAVDVDGDGALDRLAGKASWGSGHESREVVLELTRDRSKIVASSETSFEEMVHRQPIVPRLTEPSLRDARLVVELALFGRVCEVPEPSLARVLSGAPAWAPGPPTLVDSYTTLAGDHWVSYAAMNHRRTESHALTGGLVERARRGPLVLMTTAHGAVLVDEANDRHSWLFVTEVASRKLRFPSVKNAAFRGDRLVVQADGKQIDVRRPPG